MGSEAVEKCYNVHHGLLRRVLRVAVVVTTTLRQFYDRSLVRLAPFGKGIVLHNIFQNVFDSPSFLLALPHKDIALATALGRGFKVPMPIANLAERIAIERLNQG